MERVDAQRRSQLHQRRTKKKARTANQWTLDAWMELPKKIIVKVFKKCGISNFKDGTEDDLLWEEKSEREK